MFSVSSRRPGDGDSPVGRATLFVPIVALVLVLMGCTAGPDSAEPAGPEATQSDAPDAPTTTEWTAPADPDEEGPTEAPVLMEETGDLDDAIALSTDMTVSIHDLSTMTVEPETPGEFAGTAVVVKVSVLNESDRAQSIDSAVVTLVTDDGDVGIGTTAGPSDPLEGDVAAGETAEGTYVFMLDPIADRSVKVSVNYAAGEPLATFAGRLT